MMKYGIDDVQRLSASEYFDKEWYLDTYPDVRIIDMDAAEHFLRVGLAMGRDPSSRYTNHDYREAVRCGADMTRKLPEREFSATSLPSERSVQFDRLHNVIAAVVSEENFDKRSYVAAYPEVIEAQVEPYWHFTNFGFEEGREASFFDTDWYMSRYPEVLDAGFDGFEHFRQFGADEQREARFLFVRRTS